MKKIIICDKTLRRSGAEKPAELSFSGRVRIAGLLDDTKTDIIELSAPSGKTDELFIKTVSASVTRSAVSVDAGFTPAGVETAYECVRDAKKPVINVTFPMSVVQLEYICRMKPPVALSAVKECVSAAKAKGVTVEFTAVDACRAEKEFLYSAVASAIGCGADIVTLSDCGSGFAFDEFGTFIADCLDNIPGLKEKTLVVDVSDETHMACACLYSAVRAGAGGVATSALPVGDCCEFGAAVDLLCAKGDALGTGLNIYTSVVKSNIEKIREITKENGNKTVHEVAGPAADLSLDSSATEEMLVRAVEMLGYSLSDADKKAVWEAFRSVSAKKPVVTARELDAIVAGAAAQVPATYELGSYVINSGNVLTATANLTLHKNGEALTGVYVGDGPIDAAFNAIEMIVGHHYELDDFQIQALTEGRQALGKSVVCLRSDSGKLFSGTGISADIIGASILAYISALNKIAFEENK